MMAGGTHKQAVAGVSELIYEDMPRYDTWLKLLFGGIVAGMFIAGLFLLGKDNEGALVLFGESVFMALLYKVILPRRFQLFQDRLRIVFAGPFAINITLTNIWEVRMTSGKKAFAYGGLRFATSSRGVVEIILKRGLNLVISPSHPDMFIEQVNRTLSALPPQA